MPTPIRTQIKTALFARLVSATFPVAINGLITWGITSRRLVLWNKVDPSVQPGMYLVQHGEAYDNRGVGTQERRWMRLGVWCYARTDSEDVVGDDLLDIMTEAIESVMLPDDPIRNELTLGGLCFWCRIAKDDNMYIRDPGDIDGQALLVLPIRVLIP